MSNRRLNGQPGKGHVLVTRVSSHTILGSYPAQGNAHGAFLNGKDGSVYYQ